MLRLVRRRCTENRAVTSANARAVYEPRCSFSGPSPGYRRRGSSEKGSSYTCCTNKTNSFITSLLGEFSSTLPKLKRSREKMCQSPGLPRNQPLGIEVILENACFDQRKNPWKVQTPPRDGTEVAKVPALFQFPAVEAARTSSGHGRGLGLSIGELVNFS